jgi:hypothetical protein
MAGLNTMGNDEGRAPQNMSSGTRSCSPTFPRAGLHFGTIGEGRGTRRDGGEEGLLPEAEPRRSCAEADLVVTARRGRWDRRIAVCAPAAVG